MDTIELFRIFLRVAENGSFVRTAEAMNRPVSTISAAVRQLEIFCRLMMAYRLIW